MRLGLLAVLLLFLIPAAYSQNTKGDRPTGKGKVKREAKFKQGKGKKVKAKKPYNRVLGKLPTMANRASSNKKIYPQKGRFVNNRSISNKIARQNFRAPKISRTESVSPQQAKRNSSSPRVYPRSATGTTRNVFPQRGRYVNSSSKSTTVKVFSNRQTLSRNKKMGHRPDPPKRKRVVPVSASRSYISRRSINPFAGFWNKKQKGEKAYIGDISGRPLRTKNYQTPHPGVLVNPTANPYRSKPRVGDRPYKGQIMGGYVSRSRSGKAWRGDITGRKIRGRNFTSKRSMEQRGHAINPPKKSRMRVGDRPYKGRIPGSGKRSISGKMSMGGKLPGNPPKSGFGMGRYQGNIKGRKGFSPQGEEYSGSIKSRKPLKGGGSVSGRLWNNNRQALTGKQPRVSGYDVFSGNIKGRKGFSPQGEEYTGAIKARKPLKGGGSVSGRTWNNNRQALTGKQPRVTGYDVFSGNLKGRKVFSPQGEEYTGAIKARKPLKGGGSVSGKMWNNNRQAVTGKQPKVTGYDVFQGNIRGRKVFSPQGEEYTGAIKARKPVKGGGSISGKLWNNKQQAITGKQPKVVGYDVFQGRIKSGKPAKGGGSISGKLWNNNEQAINGKQPKTNGYDVYQGNLKPKKEPGKEIAGFKPKYRPFDLHPSLTNQGEEFTGFIKLPRFRKQYIKNPNTTEEGLKKSRPDKSTYMVDNLQVKIKQQDYNKRPHGAEGSMLGIGPGKNSIKASEFTKAIRQNWNYKHNPSSSEAALDQHEPGKAFVKAMNYQGNIKMKKFEFFAKKDLHPDSQFMKTNKNNTDDERNALTNFKLWWARVFKKSDTQPDHLKEKYRKPRYDKREAGLWAE